MGCRRVGLARAPTSGARADDDGIREGAFAAAVGISHAAVRNWETGRRRPKLRLASC
ncbi:helix-turn-helix domain-containing protein [Phenylobacterium sp.]|uniref:helix-turn-helix domain-containing protein n=1 Tax=Phenylobacterium sp. TaxID=1871053 RepID=UPI0034317394